MNPDQLDLARRLAAHPRFEWRRGMAALESSPSGNWQPGDYEWRILSGAPDLAAVTSEHDIHEAPYMPSAFGRAYPDLTDAATGGVLLHILGPGYELAHYSRPTGTMSLWVVKLRGRPDAIQYAGCTLAEACARALLAEWGEA